MFLCLRTLVAYGAAERFLYKSRALVGVVAVLAVILAVQFFACSVGSGCNNRLPLAAFDLIYMEMI